jgi:hypothetical protein
MNSTMALCFTTHIALMRSTRLTESSLKTWKTSFPEATKFPRFVTLPVGSYLVEARSEKDGYVRVRVVIKTGHRTTVDLASRQENSEAIALSSARRKALERQTKCVALAHSSRQDFGNKIKLNQ